jgi:hypothetical protein
VTVVSPRARVREDRAGDPLDGLVNLFDLGIVLAVAFLLAALSSLNLSPAALSPSPPEGTVPPDTVLAPEGTSVKPIQVQPGQQIVGRGEPLGTVYRLDDGRTVLVEGGQAAPAAEGTSTTPTTPTSPTTTTPTTSAPSPAPTAATTTPTEATTAAEPAPEKKGK